MIDKLVNRVYDTLIGLYEDEYAVPGVENAFAENSYCMNKYEEVYDANIRLCSRLGVIDEDKDVEVIINSMLDIQRELCFRMYEIGLKAGAGKISDRNPELKRLPKRLQTPFANGKKL